MRASAPLPRPLEMSLDGSVRGGAPVVRAALERFGPSPGGKKMMQWEREVRQSSNASAASCVYVYDMVVRSVGHRRTYRLEDALHSSWGRAIILHPPPCVIHVTGGTGSVGHRRVRGVQERRHRAGVRAGGTRRRVLLWAWVRIDLRRVAIGLML